MANESAKERRARIESERAAIEIATNEALAKAYPKLFLDTIAAAIDENFELVKVSSETGAFLFHNRDNGDDFTVFNTFMIDRDYYVSLEHLESAINWKRLERTEAERVYQLRANALSKLSTEERDALGL